MQKQVLEAEIDDLRLVECQCCEGTTHYPFLKFTITEYNELPLTWKPKTDSCPKRTGYLRQKVSVLAKKNILFYLSHNLIGILYNPLY